MVGTYLGRPPRDRLSSATVGGVSCISTLRPIRPPAIALSPSQPPPPPYALHREFRRVVADPHMHHRPISLDIVNSIGNGLALAPGRPIMHLDFVGLSFASPRPTPIFKGSDELYVRNTNRMWLTLRARSAEKVGEAGCCNVHRRASL